MNPKLFTLENIFNMDLARYKDICMEIVGNSVKELNIERNIMDVEKVLIQHIIHIIIIIIHYYLYIVGTSEILSN